MQLNLESSPSGDVTVRVAGEMDALGCADARGPLERAAHEGAGRTVRLDLHDVTFLDSSGIGSIVLLYKRLKATGGDLAITAVSGQPRELMQLLRIDQAIAIDWGDERTPAGARA